MKLGWMLSVCLLAGFAACRDAGAADLWETDFEKAAREAKETNRYMLLDFSGSDWCGWCLRLEDEVFSEREFKTYAKENLICVLLDFPRFKSLKSELKEQNERLASRYKVRGLPTILVLSPSGELVQRTGYQQGGADNYVNHLKSIIDPHRQKHNIPPPTAAGDPESKRKPPRLASLLPARVPRDEHREFRTWHSQSGTALSASLVEEDGGALVLKKEDGTLVKIDLDRLSEEDRQYVAGQRASPDAAP